MAPNTTWHVASAQQVLALPTVLIFIIAKIYVNIPSCLFAFLCTLTLSTLCSRHLMSFPTKQTNYSSRSPNIINTTSLWLFRDKHCGCETIQILPFSLFSMNPFLDHTLYYSGKKWVPLGARKRSPHVLRREDTEKKKENDNRRSLTMVWNTVGRAFVFKTIIPRVQCQQAARWQVRRRATCALGPHGPLHHCPGVSLGSRRHALGGFVGTCSPVLQSLPSHFPQVVNCLLY